jgi:hypothetical protein
MYAGHGVSETRGRWVQISQARPKEEMPGTSRRDPFSSVNTDTRVSHLTCLTTSNNTTFRKARFACSLCLLRRKHKGGLTKAAEVCTSFHHVLILLQLIFARPLRFHRDSTGRGLDHLISKPSGVGLAFLLGATKSAKGVDKEEVKDIHVECPTLIIRSSFCRQLRRDILEYDDSPVIKALAVLWGSNLGFLCA